jgi:nitrogen fixation-related uncharacterized protein
MTFSISIVAFLLRIGQFDDPDRASEKHSEREQDRKTYKRKIKPIKSERRQEKAKRKTEAKQ